jgi:hypothetical protein
MKAALSRNEMEILDRHVATLTNQLSENCKPARIATGRDERVSYFRKKRAKRVRQICAPDSPANRGRVRGRAARQQISNRLKTGPKRSVARSSPDGAVRTAPFAG